MDPLFPQGNLKDKYVPCESPAVHRHMFCRPISCTVYDITTPMFLHSAPFMELRGRENTDYRLFRLAVKYHVLQVISFHSHSTGPSFVSSVTSQDNRRVLLVERDWSVQDRIVGELMQPGGILRLKRMGLQGGYCVCG